MAAPSKTSKPAERSPIGRRRPAKKTSGWRKWLRRLGKTLIVLTLLGSGVWYAAHRWAWVGSGIADGLRAVLGPNAVAWMEDVAYGVRDKVNMWRHEGDRPKTFWATPAETGEPPSTTDRVDPGVAATAAASARPKVPQFRPAAFEAPYPKVKSEGDGTWIPIADPRHPGAPVAAYKSVVHPDPRRGFAAVAVVALDLAAYRLHFVAGTTEPASNKVKLKDRPGLIPAEHTDRLFAAFNGGFKATHGHYGMMLKDVVYVIPRDFACTFVRYHDATFRIGTWSSLKSARATMDYYRQTPPCLVENGKVHKQLHYHEYAKGWGATVSGETVIRRSSIGLSADRKMLIYGLGEAMTAQALARGMKAAGAASAAELDVNYSYPRFLFYEPQAGKPPIAKAAIIPAIDFTKDQYVTRPSARDFFYLLRHPPKTTGDETKNGSR